jgi:hypothetical protein
MGLVSVRPMLALRLLLAPALVGLASLVIRRWGPAIGGWCVGLPLTSGPVILILALERGVQFAAQAASAVLQAVVSLAAFAVAYAWSARHLRPLLSTVIACTTYVACMGMLYVLAPSVGGTVLLAGGSLLVAYQGMPSMSGPSEGLPPPKWDIPVRMVVSALLVATLTAGAALLGPRIAGLLTPFPVVASILVVATHRTNGAAAVAHLLAGLLVGLAAFAAFFLVIALAIVPCGTSIAFTAATGTALVTQGVALGLSSIRSGYLRTS